MSNNKIEIALSKNKLIANLIGSIVFLSVGILIFLNANIYGNEPDNIAPTMVKGICMVCILFFGITGWISIKKYFSRDFGLAIDSSGIIDHSNASSIGLIEWEDIAEISTKNVLFSKFLLIKIKSPEKYIGKAKSKMQAKLLQSNMKIYGTPISINSSTLKFDFETMEQLVNERFRQYKYAA